MSVAKNARERCFEWNMRDIGYTAVRVKDCPPIIYDGIAVYVPNAQDIPKVQAATELPTLVAVGSQMVGLSHHKPLPKYWYKRTRIKLPCRHVNEG